MSANKDEVLLKVNKIYNPPERVLEKVLITAEEFDRMYEESIKDPEGFWSRLAENELHWFKKWEKIREWEFPNYRWFIGGKLNITYNCLDRHVKNGKRNKVAYIYTNEDNEEIKITYGELLELVNKIANGLKSLGVEKGDRVVIYMPLVIEQLATMLACARIGAIHSVVYAGFSANALKMRIEDAKAKVVVTSTWTKRRGKKIDLKSVVDEAVDGVETVESIVVLQRDGDQFELVEREIDFYELIEKQSPECEPEVMDAEDPLFILYTSGSTGKPKGVLHTVAGYNLYTHLTTKYIFDIHEDDIYWCTADPGWITGHSYMVYGPLSVGATSVIAEGAPDYPDPGRWWSIVEKYRVNIFYTAPTAIRLL